MNRLQCRVKGEGAAGVTGMGGRLAGYNKRDVANNYLSKKPYIWLGSFSHSPLAEIPQCEIRWNYLQGKQADSTEHLVRWSIQKCPKD